MHSSGMRLALLVAVALVAVGCQTASNTPGSGERPPGQVVTGAATETEPADTVLDRFAGYWLGTTAPQGDILREATVIVEPEAGQAFTITWKNFSAADRGEGMVMREQTLRFLPDATTARWRADTTGDPIDTFSAWATLADDTLTVDIVAVGDDGALERQTYRRTVAGDEMSLLYTRLRDGADDRIIEGTLVRLSEN